ncbi:amino acid adenylation domain-containing protein, partial [Undibacterium sp. TS12]|uniref:amino acid adenylation domain-containing protein n=1 Tax=Undibacterium sp. TS12 TaxID=2908202 RepID=UPI001F4CA07F
MVSLVRSRLQVELQLRTIFEKPRLADLAEEIAHMQHSADAILSTVEAGPRPDMIPLSFSQERLWFLHQLHEVNEVYHISGAVRLEGQLNTAALEASLEQVVKRHEALHTAFQSVNGKGVQIVVPSQFKLGHAVLAPDANPGIETTRLMQEERSRPFDLEAGQLFRAVLLKVSDTDHLLILAMHHIASDGWSIDVLIREMSALYTGIVQHTPTLLPPLPVQYADFALWQRQWLQGPVINQQIDYWKAKLADAPILELPSDRIRPAVASFRGRTFNFNLPQHLSIQLNALARQEGATLFMVLMAAYQTLLSRWSGQTDVVVGTPIAGRRQRQLEGLIGFFVNTLVIRSDLSGNQTFLDLLANVRETALGAYAHQDLPFEKLVETLQPQRDLSRQPIAPVQFVLANTAELTLDLPDLTLSLSEAEKTTSAFDLNLSIKETTDGLIGVFEYATDLFDNSTIERLAGSLRVLLEAIVDNPKCSIGTLSIIDSRERLRLLDQGSSYANDPTEFSSILAAMTEQALRTPDATALICGEESINYRDLESRANQLSHYLRSLGVGPDVPVGICMERSSDMLVAVLGILKAGGAYVPIDPSYPAQRIAYLLDDAMTPVLISHARLMDHLPSHWSHVVQIDSDWPQIASLPTTAPVLRIGREHLAYIIYTSGSTGRPKGVQVRHGGLAASNATRIDYYGTPESVILLPSISFDSSVAVIFWAWCTGASICIPEHGLERDLDHLAALIQRHQLRTWLSVPSLYEAVLDTHAEKLSSLRLVISAGEALTLALQLKHFSQCPQAAFYNEYGPTEASVWTSVALLHAAEQSPQPVSIGAPIRSARVYVLDEQLQPVPVGVAGELYIAGQGLARGYLNDRSLSATRFVADPFRQDGSRMYRSGDKVRWKVDGQLDFLGRADQQVKLRGFRIELGEIEAVLMDQPGISRAAVCARPDKSGQLHLFAYLVGDGSKNTDTLRAALALRLPEHMIPSSFVELDALPLTTNGKLDYKALSAPAQFTGSLEDALPRNPIEATLVGIWADILGRDRVGIHDNFFDLGGHSLLGARLVSHIRATMQVELPLRAIFESATVAELAALIDGMQGTPQTVLPPVKALPHPELIPLSFAQERLWFLEQLHEANEAYHLSGAVRLTGILNVAALEASLFELVQRHESLRICYRTINGQGVQFLRPDNTFKMEQTDLTGLDKLARQQELIRMTRLETSRPFDLASGLLLRAHLLRIEETESQTEHVLVLTMHHISSDGRSVDVLVRELGVLYSAFAQGLPSPLSGLSLQYSDYALWQRQWLQGTVLERQLDFWKQQLAGAPAALTLPTDHPRPAVASFRGAVVNVV